MASDVQDYSATAGEPALSEDAARYEQYRALSASAVVSMLFGLLSVLTFFEWILGVIPMVGMLLGTFALLRIRRYEGELSGAAFARVGVAASLFFLVAGWGWLGYDFMTEVREGYERMPYSEVQTNAGRSEQGAVQNALKYDGKKIFVKGYTLPSASGKNMKQFIMVPDRGTCCFGGDPKITDMILVTLADPLRVDYSVFQRKLHGVFQVNKDGLRRVDKYGVIYELKADYVK